MSLGNHRRLSLLLALGALTLIPACRKDQPPPPAPEVTEPEHPLAPWSWHKLGGLLVVVGEVKEPTELTLTGHYLNEHTFAEAGPVRWEMYAPPQGEVAVLRTGNGKMLATWNFDAPESKPPAPPKPKPAPAPAKPAPRVKPLPVKPAPAPKPVPAPAPIPVPKPSAENKAWPETHLPLSKGIFRKGAAPKRTPAPPAPAVAKTPPTAKPVQPVVPKAAAIPPPTKPVPPAPSSIPPHPQPVLPPPPTVNPSAQWPGAGEALNLLRGPQGSHWICMTFDGGSSNEVAQDVLDALHERNIHTTFFVTGEFIQKYPDIIRRMVQEGHEVGNHTMHHPHFAPNMKRDPKWTKERFQQELLTADEAFLKVAGRPMDPYWRAPYGEQTAEIRKWAEELGYRHVAWSEGADTLDWATVKERKLYRTGNAILDRLHQRMDKQDGDGLIVLMHLGSARPESDRPAKVLGPFLDQALDEGWNFVNIGTYLQESGRPRWNSSKRLAMLGQTAPRQ